MRLLKRVKKLATKRAGKELDVMERAIAAGASLGVAWTERAERLEPRELAPGEHIATDVWIVDEIGSVPVWRTAERIATDPADLGTVFDGDGKRLGRVTAVKGGGRLIEWR